MYRSLGQVRIRAGTTQPNQLNQGIGASLESGAGIARHLKVSVNKQRTALLVTDPHNDSGRRRYRPTPSANGFAPRRLV
jgi:hypothetical protein